MKIRQKLLPLAIGLAIPLSGVQAAEPMIEIQKKRNRDNMPGIVVTADKPFNVPFNARVGEQLITFKEWNHVKTHWYQSNVSFKVMDPTETNKELASVWKDNRYPISALAEYKGQSYNVMCVFNCDRKPFTAQRKFKFFILVDAQGQPLDQIWSDDGKNENSPLMTRAGWTGVFSTGGIVLNEYKTQDLVPYGGEITYSYSGNNSDGSITVKREHYKKGLGGTTKMQPNIRSSIANNATLRLKQFNTDGSVSFTIEGYEVNPNKSG